MVNEIKIDQLIGAISSSPIKQQISVPARDASITRDADVTVTNHLSKLVALLGQEDISPDDSARIAATKNLIASGQYKIDVNVLADKLLNSGLLNTVD